MDKKKKVPKPKKKTTLGKGIMIGLNESPISAKMRP